MANKYQKIGFRRDKNLSDALSRTQVLNNILNNLPTVEGETFTASDLYAVKGIKNTNIDNDGLKSFANITDIYTDASNIERPINPLITLKDRIDNFKVYTGDPLFGNGGDGLLATFIPSGLIKSKANITSTTTGNLGSLYNSGTTYGPYRFWDNGFFKFDNKIFEEFNNSNGMIQWNGYFTRKILRPQTNYLLFKTTGFILIEENVSEPTDPNSGWTTLKSIYSDSIELSIAGTGVASKTLDVGSTNIKYIAKGQKITQYPNVQVVDINGTVITLSEEITVPNSATTMTFTFELGADIIEFMTVFTEVREYDKIKIRFSLWWPNPSDPDVVYNQKFMSCDNEGGDFGAPFPFFYQNYSRTYVETSEPTIAYYNKNKLNPLKGDTNNDIITSSNMIVKYTPPLIFSDRVSYANPVTVTSQDLGKIVASTSIFQNFDVGDLIVIRNSSLPTPLVYKIEQKRSNSIVYLNTLEKFAFSPEITIARYSGLVGIYNVTGGVVSDLAGNTFDHRRISPDQVITPLRPSVPTAPFLRIKSYNKTNRQIVVTNLAGNTDSISGIVFIYQDKGIEDRSKDVFCSGVVGKLTNGVTNKGSLTIVLDDVTGIVPNQYAQFKGYLLEGTKITEVDLVKKTITIDKKVINTILDNSTIVISPESVSRELCVIPLDTAFPFIGTETGLQTQDANCWLSAKDIQFEKLSITYTDLNSKLTTQSYANSVPYTKTLDVKQNGVIYKLIIV